MSKIIINKKNLPKEIGWTILQIQEREGIKIRDVFEVIKHKSYSTTELKKLPGVIPFIGGGSKPAGYTCADEVLLDVFTVSKRGSAGAFNYFEAVVMAAGAITLKLKEEYNYLNKEVLAYSLDKQMKPLKEFAIERGAIPCLTQTHILDYKITMPTPKKIEEVKKVLTEIEEIKDTLKDKYDLLESVMEGAYE